MLALGVTPVGAERTSVSDELPGFVAEAGVDPADIRNIGTIQEPDPEAIAALEPDLVLSDVARQEALYDQLDQIAPTVMAGSIAVTWKENLQLAGEALDLGDDVFVEVSQEVGQAGGDVRSYGAHGDEGQTALDRVTGAGLWPGLPAVQQGRAFEVDDDRWFLGLGPRGAGLVLDDLERFAQQLEG